MDAVEHRAVRHAGGGEHDVTWDHIIKRELGMNIAAHGAGAFFFLLVFRLEARLHLAAGATDRRGGEHAFGRAA